MDLKGITFSEKRQFEKVIYCNSTEIKKKKLYRDVEQISGCQELGRSEVWLLKGNTSEPRGMKQFRI